MRRSNSSSMVLGRGRSSSGVARASSSSSKSARQWEAQGSCSQSPPSLSSCRFDQSGLPPSTTVSFSALQRPLLAATIHFLQQLIEVEEDLSPSLQRNEMTRRFYECHYYENKSSGRIRYLVESINDCSPLTVCVFLLQILHQGIFGVAELIISIMYLLEFQKRTQVSIHTLTWRPLLVTSLLLADKMWEDKPMRLTDMTKLFPVLNSSELKQLESDLVGRLEFKIVVKPEEFAAFCERLCAEEVHPDIIRAVGDSEYWVSLQDSRGRGPRTLHSDHIAILMSKSSRLALLNQPTRKTSLSQRGRRSPSQHSVGGVQQALEGSCNGDSPRKPGLGTQSARPASARRNGSLGSLRPQPRPGGGSASSTTQGSEGNAGSFSSVISSTSSAPPQQGYGSSAYCSPRRKSSLCSSPGTDSQTSSVMPPPSWFQRTHSVSTAATSTTTPNLHGSSGNSNGVSSGSNSNSSSSNCNPSPNSLQGSTSSRVADQRPRTPRNRGSSAATSITPRNFTEGRTSTPRGYPQSQHVSSTPRTGATSTTPRGSRAGPSTPRRSGSASQAMSSPRKTSQPPAKVEAPHLNNPEAREARAMALLTAPRGYPQPMPTPPSSTVPQQRLEAGAVLRRRTPPPQVSRPGGSGNSRSVGSPTRQNGNFFSNAYANNSSNSNGLSSNSYHNEGANNNSNNTPRGVASSQGSTTFLINFNTAGTTAPGGGLAVPVPSARAPAPTTGSPNGADPHLKFDPFGSPSGGSNGNALRRRAGSLGSLTAGSSGGAASGPARRSRGSTPTRPAVQGQAARLSLATQALRRQGSMSSMLVGGSSIQSMTASARARFRGGSCAATDRARWAI